MSSEWRNQKISSLGEFDRGKSKHRPRDAAHLYGGPFPFIQTGDITNSRGRITTFRQTYSEAGLAQSRMWPAGTLAITIAANIAETALLTFPACFPDSVVGFTADSTKADVRFIEYLFQAMRKQVKSHAYGSAQENINLEVLRKLEFPIPSLETQTRIADYLTILDDRIALLRETNITLEAIAQAIFKSWFVDFDPVHAKMQGLAPEGMDEATAALFPDSFEESELGAVPKGWQAKKMADISTVGIGKTPPRKEPQWFSDDPSDIRWVSIRDMGALGAYASKTSEFLTKVAVEKFNVRIVPDNTALMSFKMTIGRVALTDGEMTTNEAIAHFKLDEQSLVTSEYIYLHLKQFDFSSLSSTSSIADAVNSKTVREIPILVPTAEIMASFQTHVSLFFTSLKNTERHAQNLATVRDTLLPRLISGQLQLPEVGQLEEAMA